jgi:hypothetical protein
MAQASVERWRDGRVLFSGAPMLALTHILKPQLSAEWRIAAGVCAHRLNAGQPTTALFGERYPRMLGSDFTNR